VLFSFHICLLLLYTNRGIGTILNHQGGGLIDRENNPFTCADQEEKGPGLPRSDTSWFSSERDSFFSLPPMYGISMVRGQYGELFAQETHRLVLKTLGKC
jgi:hypothetical protein